MPEGLRYVSPEYQDQLDELAETLMKRFGGVAVDETAEVEPIVLFESDMGDTLDART